MQETIYLRLSNEVIVFSTCFIGWRPPDHGYFATKEDANRISNPSTVEYHTSIRLDKNC